MSTRTPSRWWRICRCFLRGMRVGVLLLLLFLLVAIIYLNEVGLPGFLKRPLLEELHSRGVDLQFSRLRLRWYRGIVAENVRFGRAGQEASGPELSIKNVEVKLDRDALAKFHLKVDSLILHGGQMVWPVGETNQPPQQLTAENIQTQLRFLPNDRWELDHFSAAFAGTKLQFSGSLTNASLLRDWKIFHAAGGAQTESTRRRLRELASIIDRTKFAAPPELDVVFHGDARDVRSFNGFLTLNAPGAVTPWGILTNGILLARLDGIDATNRQPQAEVKLHADDAATRWGSTKNFQMNLHVVTDESSTNQVKASLELLADKFTTEWAQATNAQFSAQWIYSFTNPIPLAGTVGLRLADARTRWGTAREFRLDAQLSLPATNALLQADPSHDWWTNPIPLTGTAELRVTDAQSRRWGNIGELQLDARVSSSPANRPSQANSQWGAWAFLEPYFLDWDCSVKDIRAQEFELKEMGCSGLWRAPILTVTNLNAAMYQGRLNADATMDVATRAATFHATSDFDVQKADPFLTEGGRRWFRDQQFSWEKPPLAHATGGLTLPAWTNSHPDWTNEVKQTLWLQGDFKVGNASFRQVPVTSAQSHFSYTNLTWVLPDLIATRPEGIVHLGLESNDRTKDFHCHIHSTIDVKALRPILDDKVQRGLDTIVFTQPPQIDGEMWGRLRDNSRIGARANVVLTNFTFRGQAATHFHAALQYTNNFLVLTHGRIERGSQFGTASGVGVNFATRELYLTNGFSTLDPTPVLNAIGPKVAKVMEPYHFFHPPTVEVYGTIPLHEDVPADLHFKVDGGPFHWMKFNVDHISGKVDWVGQHLNLHDTRAAFYLGTLTGSAMFDFRRAEGADFSFDTIFTDTSLQPLAADLFAPTNHLEGRLSGHLNITKANTQNWQNWFGRGQIDLHDGLIWEFPIFGIFSKVLDGIYPGLGESRASDGTATFVIANSVIHTEDLEIRSPVFRMLYRGTVSFDGKVDVVVEARLLRDFWLVGPIISTALSPLTKIFEYTVTGSLSHPKSEPRFLLPAIFLSPFHWFHSLITPPPKRPAPIITPPSAPPAKSP